MTEPQDLETAKRVADPSELPFESKRAKFDSPGQLLEFLYLQWKEHEHLPGYSWGDAALLAEALQALPPSESADAVDFSVFLSARQQAKRKEVQYAKLPPSARSAFQEAMKHEWHNISKLEAVELLDPKEAQQARQVWAHRTIRSRWVFTEKESKPDPQDSRRLSNWLMAKARWVVLGHTDPDLGELSTFAPALPKDGFMWSFRFWLPRDGNSTWLMCRRRLWRETYMRERRVLSSRNSRRKECRAYLATRWSDSERRSMGLEMGLSVGLCLCWLSV